MSAGAGPITQDTCTDPPSVSVFAPWESSLENLAFTNGSLYVSDAGTGRLLRFLPDASNEIVAEAAAIHGVAVNATGSIHFTARPDATRGWEVWRLLKDGAEVVTPQSIGWNGMAFDAAGNLYLSDEAFGLYRILARDPGNSSLWAEAEGANGIVVDDANGVLYTAITDDQRSTILRIALDDPTEQQDAAHLSFGAVRVGVFQTPPPVSLRPPSDPTLPLIPKGLDDLTFGPDGMIYAAAHLSGEILRIDSATGEACVLVSGLKQPSSVRFATGFGEWDGDLFVTTFGGVGVTAFVPGTPIEPALLVIDTNLVADTSGLTDDALVPVIPSAPREAPGLGVWLSVLVMGALVLSGRFPKRSTDRSVRKEMNP